VSVVQTTYTVPVFPPPPEDMGYETTIQITLGKDEPGRGEIWRGAWLKLSSAGVHPQSGLDCLACGHGECCGEFRLPVAAIKQFLDQNPGVLE
jgi:hypothetical protein